jgi:chemotaxis protein methyltransferase CheR
MTVAGEIVLARNQILQYGQQYGDPSFQNTCRQLNLITTELQEPALPPLDLILLRNVLVYFDSPTKRQIMDRVRRVLRPDGYLMLGGAETTHNLNDGFIPVSFEQTSFFRLRPD